MTFYVTLEHTDGEQTRVLLPSASTRDVPFWINYRFGSDYRIVAIEPVQKR